ncbi:sodium-dependent bicarbonate transport family permease [Planctomicrobium sp. SH661]|uniref:sodium-dependent bicarbonate transport family permease n=1 Tax=Planctomicrobium sp. SH661 TaxID=3448124 RepID=UPI003F5B2AC6
MSLLQEFGYNFIHNLFKPLLLFFYAGFLIPILKMKFEFPKVLYQSITIYLLLAIGWHGGEELASLSRGDLVQALGFMVIGFFTNLVIGCLAYSVLRLTTGLRQIDAATVAGYYGSDSAGTFVTCVGVLTATGIAYAAYMPVMLAVMEIPGCLVALVIVARLRRNGMDANGNMPGERGYDRNAVHSHIAIHEPALQKHVGTHSRTVPVRQAALVAAGIEEEALYQGENATRSDHMSGDSNRESPEDFEDDISLQEPGHGGELVTEESRHSGSLLNKELLHEVFFNPGIYLLFSGILIGFISQLQGPSVTKPDDTLFVNLFPPILCLFLLEMGMTASQKLGDLRSAGWKFVAFAVLAPNLFATLGICIAHAYSMFLGQTLEIGTYALFAVLCGAASYIALPAVQRMAIPEASPTLPLAASLGCTFSYNVTIGIPVYILIAKIITRSFPVAHQVVAAMQSGS